MMEIMDKIYDFTLTMDGELLEKLFGEHLGKHLWESYYGLRRDWMRWYGHLDEGNRKIICNYLETLTN